MSQYIASKHNQLVKQVLKLGNNRNYRNISRLSVVYGLHLVEEAFKYNVLECLIVDEAMIHKYATILDQLGGVDIYTTNQGIIKKLNLLDSEIDLVGVINFTHRLLDNKLYTDDCIILECIQNPSNLGAILRVAKASGISNVILSNNSVDPYSPKSLLSSQGAIFGLNIYSDINVVDFVDKCQTRVIATSPHVSDNLYTINLISPVAWVFGNEGAGISDMLFSKIKYKVSIPIHIDTESLNVAMAATVCLFEQQRQRYYSK